MTAGYLEISTTDGAMPAYHCSPEGEGRGAIAVIQEVFGLTMHIESICQRLAAAGWDAIAPAFFHRAGSPVVDYGDPAPGVELMHTMTAEAIAVDLDATLAHLEGLGFSGRRVGAVGFCLGGSLSLFFATRHELGAAVSFYGVGIATGQAGLPPLVELAPLLRCPWLGLYGELDTRAPADQVSALRNAAASSPVPTELVVYENAGHAFNCDARPDRFSPEAASDGWRRTLALFSERVG